MVHVVMLLTAAPKYSHCCLNIFSISALHVHTFHRSGKWRILYLFWRKKGNSYSVSNCRPISLLGNFSGVFEFAIHRHKSHCLKHKLNPSQPFFFFSKAKSTAIINFVTYLYFISPLVLSQRQVECTGLSKKMDGIWNCYNLKSTGRIYTFGVLKCSEEFKVLDLP